MLAALVPARCRDATAATKEESRPPESSTPKGTSVISLFTTACKWQVIKKHHTSNANRLWNQLADHVETDLKRMSLGAYLLEGCTEDERLVRRGGDVGFWEPFWVVVAAKASCRHNSRDQKLERTFFRQLLIFLVITMVWEKEKVVTLTTLAGVDVAGREDLKALAIVLQRFHLWSKPNTSCKVKKKVKNRQWVQLR
jgi:hypothetical protein